MYPSILISNLLIPLQQGEFNIISNNEFQEKEYYAYGLYHCIINNASCGAIIFYKPYFGPAYDFDIISMYPSILLNKLFVSFKLSFLIIQ